MIPGALTSSGTSRDSAATARHRVAGRGLVMVWAAVAMLFTYRLSSTIVDLDLFHQMALVREWRTLGTLPLVDLYAFTPTIQPFMHHEWGAGALAYAVAAAVGGAGISLLRFALGLGLAIVIVRTALRTGASPIVIAMLAPVAIVLVESGFPPLRAHAYSFLFAAILLHLCERDRAERSWRLWTLVPLFALWVNFHGGFVLGVALLGVHAAERALRREGGARVVLVLVAVVAVAVVNPYGLGYYAHIARSLAVDRALVSEWGPIWQVGVPVHQQVAFGAAVGVVAYGLAFGKRGTRNGLLILGVTAILSVRHHRLLPFFGVAWLVYCPALLNGTVLDHTLQSISRHQRTLVVVSGVIAVAAGALIWSAHPLRLRVPNDPVDGDPGAAPYYPVQAVAFLEAQRFRGNLLTPFGQGSYVLWKLYPAVKVSLDSRYEAVYEPSLVEELTRVYETGEGLSEVLEKYGGDAVLVPLHSRLASADIPLRKVHQDASFAVYARPGAGLHGVSFEPPGQEDFP